MPDLLSNSTSWLAGRLQNAAGETVTYERGLDSASLTAVIGRTEWDSIEGEGLVTRIESEDFLIEAADLVLAGEQTEPQRGDRIKRTIGGTTHVFEVLPFGAAGDEQPFRYSDRSRSLLRVHTKHTGTE